MLTDDPTPERPRRVLGGVAALIAERLSCNPFWLRMAFVGLALAGGLGLVVYLGLWLVLVVGAPEHRRLTRILGGTVVVAGPLILLSSGETEFLDGSEAVVALLLGLGLALWQPRATTDRVLVPRFAERPAAAPRPPRRPPSVLGQATLGLAVVAAAVGALIDQANGGRLHPEQWLGVAAAVCGVGMLVGVVWGRARWLILPAALFAGAGYVGGTASERGISLLDGGDRSVELIGGARGDVAVSFGNVDVSVYQLPATAQTRDISVLVGDVSIWVDVATGASIDLRWDIAHGSATFDGVDQPRTGSRHFGPSGEPDLVLDVSIWRGDLTLWNQEIFIDDGSLPDVPPPVTIAPSDASGLSPTYVADGVSATDDGFFLIADGEAMIDDDDRVILGSTSTSADGVTEISTSYGNFRLLPRSLLLTPYNEVIDLQRWRELLAPTTTLTDPSLSSTTTEG